MFLEWVLHSRDKKPINIFVKYDNLWSKQSTTLPNLLFRKTERVVKVAARTLMIIANMEKRDSQNKLFLGVAIC